MKPRPTPCCFSNASLCSLRKRMTSVMSHSLKVVSIAAECCAWTRRSAIFCRSLVIFSRREPRLPAGMAAPDARLDAGLDAGLGDAVTETGLVSVEAAGLEVAANTSSFITRPDGPDPARCARSTPFSAATFFATLEARNGSEAVVAAAAWVAAALAVGAVAGLAVLVSIEATTAPTLMASPFAVEILSIPAAGARNSSVALSDSISARRSSFST